MESLSSTHADSYWSMDQQDLVPTRSAFTIPRTKAKTSDYETGLSAAEYDEDEELQSVNVAGRVKKVLRAKKNFTATKESPSEASELLSRLAMLEEQVRMMGNQLREERQQREELEQKVEKLQVENEHLQSERKVAGEQLQSFSKKFFESINAIPPHLMHNGLSTSSLNRSTASMRRSGISINSLTSQ